MFEIYATIACVLILTGGLSATYFAKYFIYKKDIFLWTVMLESAMTVLIGLLYIYGAILWSNEEPQNFQVINNIDDLAVVNNTHDNSNDELFNELQQLLTVEDMHIFPNLSDIDNKIEDTRENHNLNYDFYQGILKFLINQKMKNNLLTIRKSKQIQMIETEMSQTDEIECFYMKTFLQHALMLYSFVHCVMMLVNYSMFYYSYIPEATLEVGTKAVEPCEVVKTPEHTDQLFQKIQVTENTEPPVHLFNVKMDTETQKNDQRNVAKLIKTPSIKKQLLQMLVEIIFIAILTCHISRYQ
ncbi:uncharacterized protein LOC132696074 isoform X3 [Cylas formicarius]|uniref:uncharacterized protein LOC132696074 isoform X3 n=1 Tax=Cylas formicarius TaxID=197179 RepID=UPI0029583EC6|nr:uncharacterized protein LOC132696074 isoform X3 [Cylas formicarius]